jgi:hypothetical protein
MKETLEEKVGGTKGMKKKKSRRNKRNEKWEKGTFRN